jgi:hypothetical protein
MAILRLLTIIKRDFALNEQNHLISAKLIHLQQVSKTFRNNYRKAYEELLDPDKAIRGSAILLIDKGEFCKSPGQ